MNGAGETFEAILGLLIGGMIFVVFGAALSETALESSSSFMNFELWGVIYILGAVVLAILFIVGVVGAFLNDL